jgi:nucleoside-diphosphate-sugar epimerase
MKILVTGTEGYIGSVLTPLLMQRGYDVIGLDTGFFKSGWLYTATSTTPKTLNKDLRHLTAADLTGVEAVIHMAELSNDPTGQLAPTITYEINHHGSLHIAALAKAAGVRRFIYMSSCSVYGVSTQAALTESDPVNPQTAYAICKTRVERDLAAIADDDFSPTFLRNASVFGASPRIRFDIVLNLLAGMAWTTKQIRLTSNGTPWRPLVHVLDVCKAILCTLEASRDIVHNQIFNVGDNSNNYQVKDIAAAIAAVFEPCPVTLGTQEPDNRNYRVSFDKINCILPGFKCDWNAYQGAQQLHQVFARIQMTPEVFQSRNYTRLKQLEYLIRTQQIDEQFFWRPLCDSLPPS